MKTSNLGNGLVSISLGSRRWVALACLVVGVVGSPSAVPDAPPVFEPPPSPGAASYDGIYQWSSGNYLSLHQDGTRIIGTIYFNVDGTSVSLQHLARVFFPFHSSTFSTL